MNLENYRSTNPSVRRIQLANKRKKIKNNYKDIKSFFWILIIIRIMYLIKTKQLNALCLIPIYNNFKNYLLTLFSNNPLVLLGNFNNYTILYNSFKYIWTHLPNTL
jgi:hypothetical protein